MKISHGLIMLKIFPPQTVFVKAHNDEGKTFPIFLFTADHKVFRYIFQGKEILKYIFIA